MKSSGIVRVSCRHGSDDNGSVVQLNQMVFLRRIDVIDKFSLNSNWSFSIRSNSHPFDGCYATNSTFFISFSERVVNSPKLNISNVLLARRMLRERRHCKALAVGTRKESKKKREKILWKEFKSFRRNKVFWEAKSFNQYENLIAIIIRIERNAMNWSILDKKISIASADKKFIHSALGTAAIPDSNPSKFNSRRFQYFSKHCQLCLQLIHQQLMCEARMNL